MWDLMSFPLRCKNKQTLGYITHEASTLSRVRFPVRQFAPDSNCVSASCAAFEGWIEEAAFSHWDRWRNPGPGAPITTSVRRLWTHSVKSVERDGRIGSVDATVAAIAVSDVLKYCRAGPSFGAIVLRPADEPAGRPIVLRKVFELRDNEPVVAVLPGDATVRAAEETTIISDVDGVWLT